MGAAKSKVRREVNMKKFVLFAAMCLISVRLMAQDSKVDIFGGYQYLHSGDFTANGTSQPDTSVGYNGWDIAPAYKFNKFLGAEADFSGGYGSVSGISNHIYTYTGGPIVTLGLPVIQPFAHALFGGAHLTSGASGVSVSTNGYTLMVGGGVDAKLNRLLAVRVAQVDWLYYHFSGYTADNITTGSLSGSNNVRISTGVVLRFYSSVI
jgi:hypothetical protein